MPEQEPKDNVIRPDSFQGPTRGTASGDGNGTDGMTDRLSRIESTCEGLKTAIEGIRHTQNLIIAVIAIGFGLFVAIAGYTLTKIDALPEDFLRMNAALSGAITAAKQQQPPQVVVVPAPQPPPPQSK